MKHECSVVSFAVRHISSNLLSVLLVGLMIYHSDQVDVLLRHIGLQLRHAVVVLDLEDGSVEVRSFG